MGFYYGSSEPPEDDKSGGLRETLLIIAVVFRVLALPLGIMFGGILGLVVLFWLFTLSGWAGLAAILAIAFGVAAYGFWEYRHPPTIEGEGKRLGVDDGVSKKDGGTPWRME